MSENLYNVAANHITSGARGKDVGTVIAAIMAMRDGTVTFDQSASSGKGAFKGGDKVARTLFDSGLGEDMSVSGIKGDVSKACKVVSVHLAHLVSLSTSEDEIETAVIEWRKTSGAVSGLYAGLTPPNDEDKPRRLLAAIVASMLNEAIAAGYEPSAIVEEVQAQLSGPNNG